MTHYSRIYDTDHSNDELFAIAYDATTKSYTYWYSDPATQAGWTEPANYHQMGADEHINASGECYVIFIDGKWDFKAAGTLDGDALRETVKGIDGNHQLKRGLCHLRWRYQLQLWQEVRCRHLHDRQLQARGSGSEGF